MAYIVLAGIYLLLLNIITTIRLSKSELNEKSQKVYQTILIWLLPLIGAVIVSTLLNQDEPVEFKNKNIFKNFMLFVFFIKRKKDENKEHNGYEKTESAADVYHASFQAGASEL